MKELQENFPVDIYGKCGTKKCPPNGNCYEYLANNYMFYLSFENSICQGKMFAYYLNVLQNMMGKNPKSKIAFKYGGTLHRLQK